MVNTIFMMDAYWMGFMHTKQIKSAIIRDNLSTPPKKRGGDMTGAKNSKTAKTEHDRIIELGVPLVQAGKNLSNVARILKDKHGVERTERSITGTLKKHLDSKESP